MARVLTDKNREMLEEVHRDVYAVFDWTSDQRVFNTPEFWSRPAVGEDTGRLYGDCEDFAIEVHHRLRARGFPKTMLRLAVCKMFDDSPGMYDHCVLVIEYKKSNGDTGYLVSECNTPTVVPVEKLQKKGYHNWFAAKVGKSMTEGWVRIAK